MILNTSIILALLIVFGIDKLKQLCVSKTVYISHKLVNGKVILVDSTGNDVSDEFETTHGVYVENRIVYKF